MSCERGVRQCAEALRGAGIPDRQARAIWATKSRGAGLKKQVDGHLAELAKLTDEARISDEMNRYLETMAQFHRYSLHNQMLILMSRPGASLVAGYKKWQKLGRQVKRGEKGIAILVPRPWRKEIEVEDPDTGEPKKEVREGLSFGVGYVFDVSQTDGDPVPEAPRWTNEGEEGEELAGRLDGYAKGLGISVSSGATPGRAEGVSRGGSIVLREGLTPLGRASTLCHEIAHEIMHPPELRTHGRRQTNELEAEATAYVVCKHFGYDINSPNYLALWSADSKKLRQRMGRISGAARQIIEKIEDTGD